MEVTVQIANAGKTVDREFSISLFTQLKGEEQWTHLQDWKCEGLKKNRNMIYKKVYDFNKLGEYLLKAEIDSRNDSAEINETDDETMIEIFFAADQTEAQRMPMVHHEIEVVATRVPETPHEVSASIEVISGDTLRAMNAT
jgi:CARDB